VGGAVREHGGGRGERGEEVHRLILFLSWVLVTTAALRYPAAGDADMAALILTAPARVPG
jgi:hypothetical protein